MNANSPAFLYDGVNRGWKSAHVIPMPVRYCNRFNFTEPDTKI